VEDLCTQKTLDHETARWRIVPGVGGPRASMRLEARGLAARHFAGAHESGRHALPSLPVAFVRRS
jgi:hypothetical protein